MTGLATACASAVSGLDRARMIPSIQPVNANRFMTPSIRAQTARRPFSTPSPKPAHKPFDRTLAGLRIDPMSRVLFQQKLELLGSAGGAVRFPCPVDALHQPRSGRAGIGIAVDYK